MPSGSLKTTLFQWEYLHDKIETHNHTERHSSCRYMLLTLIALKKTPKDVMHIMRILQIRVAGKGRFIVISKHRGNTILCKTIV